MATCKHCKREGQPGEWNRASSYLSSRDGWKVPETFTCDHCLDSGRADRIGSALFSEVQAGRLFVGPRLRGPLARLPLRLYFSRLVLACMAGKVSTADRLADASREGYRTLTDTAERLYGVGWTGLVEDVRRGYASDRDLYRVASHASGMTA